MRVSLRTALVVMLLMATVPVAVLMSWLLLEKMRSEQHRMRADLDREAEVLAQAVDNELLASIEALRILGLSESLRHGDVREFERSVAGRGPLRSGWKGSFLTDTRGLVIFDTTGAGRRGALSPVPGFRQMLWDQTPMVSGLVEHKPSGQAATVIAVPVVIDGNLRFGLGVWVPWAAWQVLLKRSAPAEGYSALFDRERRIIARSTEPLQVGELLPEATVPGVATYDAAAPVALSGWGVRRAVAMAPVAAGQLRSIGLAWATAAACLLLGVTMALLLARRIRRPLEAMARGGGAGSLGAVHVREIAALRDALQAARERDQAARDGLRRKADEFETLLARQVETHQQLQAASHAKDEFLAMLGHELRNPLNAISTAVEVLQHDRNADPMIQTARGIVRRQTLRLSHMIGDLLDMTRVLSGKVTLVREPLALATLVQRVLDKLASVGDTAHHALQTAFDDEAWVDGDASRLEQVVNNLVCNAIKYSPAGRRISVSVQAKGQEVVLRVVDEGDGIPPDLLARVFDLFVQGTRSLDRSAGGLGIGLTLVKRLVELHGGSVGATSSPAGSCFEVRLPRVAAVRAATVHEGSHPQGLKVLVIEDNPDALQSMGDVLRLAGHQVVGETSGRTGLATLLEQWPDVAIVDIGLPEMNGYEVALNARSRGYPGRMIAVSGYGLHEDAQRAMRSGFDMHAVKPVDAQQLRSWMREGAHA